MAGSALEATEEVGTGAVARQGSALRASGARVRGADLPTFLLHWLLAAAFAVAFVTGVRIAADDPRATLAHAVAGLAPQGDVIAWHLGAAWLLLPVLTAYVLLLARARAWRRLAVGPGGWRALAGGSSGPARWRALNVLLYWAAFACLAVLAATGLLAYFEAPAFSAETLRTIHRTAAWLLLAYVPLHVLGQAAQGGWRQLARMLWARRAHLAAGTGAGVVAAGLFAALFGVEELSPRSLEVAQVASPPRLDGLPTDAQWQRAAASRVHTTGGANLPQGAATVTVRAVHDGERAWFLFEWPDPTRSLKHLPLVKTERGWQVLQEGFAEHDEDVYYEDKFAVMLARADQVPAAGTIHLGTRPLPGRPGPAGGRGLHYTTDGSLVDIWHWKAVRSGLSMGLADDNHFGPPLEPYAVDPHFWRRAPVEGHEESRIRYTGGYEKDWKTDGGVGMNWEIFQPEGVTPLRLPADPGVLLALGRVDLTPHVSDTGRWWMEVDESVPYTPEADHFPVGTVIPSVLLKGPMTGDRGDVRAQATWEAGRWRLEMTRRLDTGSEDDVPIRAGTHLWVAVFDHTQTRHSYHLHPLRLRLEQ